MKLVFIGPPAADKGTYASILSDIFKIPHISTGELFRGIAKKKSKLGKKLAKILEKGELVSDNTDIKILKKELSTLKCEKGFILDGYPWTIPQAEALDENMKIDTVVNIDVPEKVVMDRALYRVSCEKCGEVYNKRTLKPKKEGVCDKCGGKLVRRSDETLESLKERIKEYHEKTEQLKNYYEDSAEVKIIEIYNDRADIDSQIMVNTIVSELKKQGIMQ